VSQSEVKCFPKATLRTAASRGHVSNMMKKGGVCYREALIYTIAKLENLPHTVALPDGSMARERDR
jgi:hypothetical protein